MNSIFGTTMHNWLREDTSFWDGTLFEKFKNMSSVRKGSQGERLVADILEAKGCKVPRNRKGKNKNSAVAVVALSVGLHFWYFVRNSKREHRFPKRTVTGTQKENIVSQKRSSASDSPFTRHGRYTWVANKGLR